jgi:hypothetical protein
MNIDYRKDVRTDEQFDDDIFNSHIAERKIIERYAQHLRDKYNMEVVIEDNGVDNSGKPLDSATTDADFLLNGKLIEVKFAEDNLSVFRLKKDQVKSYIEQDAPVLFVNGWETDNPVFTIIKPDRLIDITRTRRAKPFAPWGHKLCYFLNSCAFKWFNFE